MAPAGDLQSQQQDGVATRPQKPDLHVASPERMDAHPQSVLSVRHMWSLQVANLHLHVKGKNQAFGLSPSLSGNCYKQAAGPMHSSCLFLEAAEDILKSGERTTPFHHLQKRPAPGLYMQQRFHLRNVDDVLGSLPPQIPLNTLAVGVPVVAQRY